MPPIGGPRDFAVSAARHIAFGLVSRLLCPVREREEKVPRVVSLILVILSRRATDLLLGPRSRTRRSVACRRRMTYFGVGYS